MSNEPATIRPCICGYSCTDLGFESPRLVKERGGHEHVTVACRACKREALFFFASAQDAIACWNDSATAVCLRK